MDHNIACSRNKRAKSVKLRTTTLSKFVFVMEHIILIKTLRSFEKVRSIWEICKYKGYLDTCQGYSSDFNIYTVYLKNTHHTYISLSIIGCSTNKRIKSVKLVITCFVSLFHVHMQSGVICMFIDLSMYNMDIFYATSHECNSPTCTRSILHGYVRANLLSWP